MSSGSKEFWDAIGTPTRREAYEKGRAEAFREGAADWRERMKMQERLVRRAMAMRFDPQTCEVRIPQEEIDANGDNVFAWALSVCAAAKEGERE